MSELKLVTQKDDLKMATDLTKNEKYEIIIKRALVKRYDRRIIQLFFGLRYYAISDYNRIKQKPILLDLRKKIRQNTPIENCKKVISKLLDEELENRILKSDKTEKLISEEIKKIDRTDFLTMQSQGYIKYEDLYKISDDIQAHLNSNGLITREYLKPDVMLVTGMNQVILFEGKAYISPLFLKQFLDIPKSTLYHVLNNLKHFNEIFIGKLESFSIIEEVKSPFSSDKKRGKTYLTLSDLAFKTIERLYLSEDGNDFLLPTNSIELQVIKERQINQNLMQTVKERFAGIIEFDVPLRIFRRERDYYRERMNYYHEDTQLVSYIKTLLIKYNDLIKQAPMINKSLAKIIVPLKEIERWISLQNQLLMEFRMDSFEYSLQRYNQFYLDLYLQQLLHFAEDQYSNETLNYYSNLKQTIKLYDSFDEIIVKHKKPLEMGINVPTEVITLLSDIFEALRNDLANKLTDPDFKQEIQNVRNQLGTILSHQSQLTELKQLIDTLLKVKEGQLDRFLNKK